MKFYFLGILEHFVNGVQMGSTNNLGQIAFATNLDQVIIGFYDGFDNRQSVASVQFYLRSLPAADIVLAMNQSYTLASNPSCMVNC